jgi:hypothetical protein
MFLFRAHVQRPACDREAEQIAIELEAVLGASHRHGRVIDPKEQVCPSPLPDRIPLAFREPD